MHLNNGMVTTADILSYEPVVREPLIAERQGTAIYTNPPPSFGGSIALGALADLPVSSSWVDVVESLNEHTIRQRNDPAQRSKGTTHVSVIDRDGYVAAMTLSIGTGSGVVVPGWGVQLNNMAGEEDLNPAGLHSLEPGTRMGSMMAPTLLVNPDGSVTGFGTGGSERIRSTTAGIIIRLIDESRSLLDAVDAPRIHPAPDGSVQCEPGLPEDVVAALEASYRVNNWRRKDFYFGGVHAVRRGSDGSVTAVGDGRRGGHVEIVFPDEMSHSGA
jgi:gamma-glutamyltranspeptidase/glutathione hydrolase